MNCMHKISLAVEHFFELVFSKIGILVWRYSWQCLLASSVIDIALCAGWIKRNYVTDVKDTWIPKGSQSIVDYDRYSSIFGKDIKMHGLYVTSPGHDLLTKDNMLKLFKIMKDVVSQPDLAHSCQVMSGSCFVNSPLFAWMNMENLLMGMADDQAVKLALKNSKQVNISAFTGEYDPETVSSSYVWMMFFQLSENETAVNNFETYFDDLRELEGLAVFPNSAGSQGRELKKSVTDDLMFLGISYALCLFFIALTLGKLKCGQTRIFLGLMSIIETGLAFAGCIGLGSFCGIAYTPPVSVIPFIILGIATDNSYLLTRFMDSSTEETSEKRFIDSFASSGATISISTMTNIVAFGIGAITPIPALSTFGGFASLCFFLNYLLTYFFTGPLLAMETRWKENGRVDPFFCGKMNEKQKEAAEVSRKEDGKFEKYSIWFYENIIMTLPAKIVLVILLLAMIAVSIYATLQFRITYSIRLMIPKNSYLDHYYELQETKFSKINGQIYVVNQKPMDLATAEGRVHFNESITLFKTTSFLAQQQSDTWFESFLFYVKTQKANVEITTANFISLINDFLSFPAYTRYQADFIFTDDTKTSLSAVKSSYSYVPITDGLDTVKLMQDARKKLPDKDYYPWSYEFITAGQYEDIGTQVLQNLLIAIAIVFVIILLMLADFWASLMVTIIVAAIDVAVFGFFLTWWGVDVNTISAGNLVIVIGLSVDYSAHVMHAFLNPTGKYKTAVLDAIAEVGLAVLLGGVSTFLAVFPLAFCQSSIFVIFFKTFFGTIVAGLLYSLILLPILLSWIGPRPHIVSNRIESMSEEDNLDDEEEKKKKGELSDEGLEPNYMNSGSESNDEVVKEKTKLADNQQKLSNSDDTSKTPSDNENRP